MNKTIGNPIYYYYRTRNEHKPVVLASFDPIHENKTTDYIKKEFLFIHRMFSVKGTFDSFPDFFNDKYSAGCVAVWKDVEAKRYEVRSPLTGTFLLAWAYDMPGEGRTPKYGDIVFADKEGTMQLTFKRTSYMKRIEISFQRMIVENHEWEEKYYNPTLTLCDETFTSAETWNLSLSQWHELVVPLGKKGLPDPILSFSDECDEGQEERSFGFQYLDRRFLTPSQA